MLARHDKPARDFDTAFRTAMTFLGNPQKLWRSEHIEYQRVVLKLALRIGCSTCAEADLELP